jgi:gas vesicle protein
MSDSYDRYDNKNSGGYMIGLLTGTLLGAGLSMLLAPKAGADLRGAVGEQARSWGNAASEQYRHARETAGTWAEKGRDMVNQAREAATHAAEQARGYAGGSPGSSQSTGTSYGDNTGTTSSSGSSGGHGNTPGGDFNRT